MKRSVNPWEARARAAKVRRLVRMFDEIFEALGLVPERDGIEMAQHLRGFGDAEWASAGINIGADHVGVLTRLAVLKHYTEAQKAKAS